MDNTNIFSLLYQQNQYNKMADQFGDKYLNGQLNVILNQVSIFAILMLIGFVGARTKVIPEESLKYLAQMIVKIILPCLIFKVVAGSNITHQDFYASWKFALAVAVLFSLLPVVGFFIGKFFKLTGTSLNVIIALITFGNMGFVGIPLINEVYHDPLAGVSITVYTLIDMALLWTFGVYLCSRHLNNQSVKNSIKNMLNPTTITLIFAMFILFLNIKLPRVILETVYGIGGTSKYLTMIYLGAALSFINHKGILKKAHIFVLAFFKMFIIPVAMFSLFRNFLPYVQSGILTIVSGLPTMTTIVMLAKNYESDDRLATETIFVTTVACLVAFPLVNIVNILLWG